MEQNNEKCVLVIDEALPLGIIANTAGIMGITLGKYIPEAVGPAVYDKSGNAHLGIITFPVPILKACKEKIQEMRRQLFEEAYQGLTVVDFSDAAQSCKAYDEFIEKAANTKEEDLTYFGIGICGAKKLVNKLTGNLPLLR